MLLTLRTDSSALHRVQMQSRTSMLLSQQRRIQSSRMLLLILMITQFGGRDSIRIFRQTLLTGRATNGMLPNLIRLTRAHMPLIRTQDSLLRLLTARASLLSLTRARVCRFRQLSSADAVQNVLRWFISQRAGRTVCSSVPQWLPRQPLPQQGP